jgi:hypothetical protein
MIISVLFPALEVLSARLADLRARMVPRLRWERSDLLGLVALCLSVFWNPRMHSCEVCQRRPKLRGEIDDAAGNS